MKNVRLQHDYISTLLAPIPISSTGEIAVSLSVEIDADMGFIIIDRDIDTKEERMFFHRKNANTVYVYSENRDMPRQHDVGANVILNVLDTINYSVNIGFPQMYIFKKSKTDVIITGGNFFINKRQIEIPNLDTEGKNLFTHGETNNIYIKDNSYYVTVDDVKDLYLVGKINVDISGNIASFEMARTLSVGDGLSIEDKNKLDLLDPNAYEHKTNKTNDIRDDSTASDTLYPTEKAVALKLKNKVDKVDGKDLSEQNFTQAEKDFISLLMGLNLDSIDFSKLYDIRQDIRNLSSASGSEVVSEFGIAKALQNYIKKSNTKDLSTNDFTNFYKSQLDNLISSIGNYLSRDDVTRIVNQLSTASNDKIPTERAVRLALENKVDKYPGRGLSEVNFSQDDKNKLDSLGDTYKTSVVAGNGILVEDLGDDGWKVSTDLSKAEEQIGGNIDVFPVTKNAYEKFIDEQRYIILTDTARTGFFGQSTFKNAKNPVVKVFYHNPNNTGKIMIDVHTRVIKSNGEINERHDSIPYQVDVKHGHGVFLLRPSSFLDLDYNNSEVLYIKVFRVGAYYTDKTGNENNVILNDKDTVVGDVRIKSMYVSYTSTVNNLGNTTLPNNGYNGILYDGQCNRIAEVNFGVITKNLNKFNNLNNGTNSNGISYIIDNYQLTNCEENRNIDTSMIVTETDLVNNIYTLIEDLREAKILQNINNSNSSILNDFNISNFDELKNLDLNNLNIKSLVDFIGTLLKELKTLKLNNSNCKKIENLMSINKNWIINNNDELRELDIQIATINDYYKFIATLINDLNNAGLFNGSVVNKTNNEFNVLNANNNYILDNQTNSLNDFGNLLFSLIKDLKYTQLIN